jgi:acetylornithine/N-succinyldiaminopimelate aminotransferase
MRKLIQKAEEYYLFVSVKPPIVMERGKGMFLYDVAGKRYLDFIGGWAVNCLGHCYPAITRALKCQAGKLINASPSLYNRPQIEFAELLVKQTCMDKVFFLSTGAEANEGAIKLARKYGSKHKNGAYEIITTRNSFHGRTLATMAATGKEQWKTLFAPGMPGFVHVDFNDLRAVKQNMTEQTIAVMIEPVQGEGGAVPASMDYIRGLRKLCDEKGILLIFDEIQTGYGRTGKFFAYQYFGVEPDIMTLGKGIGGGFPLAALLAKDKFCVFEKGEQGGTYTGQPLAMSVGLAVLKEMLDRNISAHVEKMGFYLKSKLEILENKGLIENSRGLGLLQAFDLKKSTGEEVLKKALKKGLILNSPRPQTIRLIPPLIVEKKHIDEMISILATTLPGGLL